MSPMADTPPTTIHHHLGQQLVHVSTEEPDIEVAKPTMPHEGGGLLPPVSRGPKNWPRKLSARGPPAPRFVPAAAKLGQLPSCMPDLQWRRGKKKPFRALYLVFV